MKRFIAILTLLLLAGCARPKPATPPRLPKLAVPVVSPKHASLFEAPAVIPPAPKVMRFEWPDGYCPWGFEVQESMDLRTWRTIATTHNLWWEGPADREHCFYRVMAVPK